MIFEKTRGRAGTPCVNKKYIGKNASVILKELGITAGPEVRLVLVEVPNEHPLIWTEQMMPVLPLARVRNVDDAIDLAVAAEGSELPHGHDALARTSTALSTMARECNCSIFVKNGRRWPASGGGRGLHVVHDRLARRAKG